MGVLCFPENDCGHTHKDLCFLLKLVCRQRLFFPLVRGFLFQSTDTVQNQSSPNTLWPTVCGGDGAVSIDSRMLSSSVIRSLSSTFHPRLGLRSIIYGLFLSGDLFCLIYQFCSCDPRDALGVLRRLFPVYSQ
ncbi:hypothetical protein CSKR_202637 [Clonorchis sinensis]|uniref:Uncharacterized protein n=1 Tax=Clonorchis sinensis TaxID=79923 RepID=A0A8T1M1J7_CLOSI|nr:hypothetical protein CSKR_202637 [Clonorchis sinensis]